MVIAKCTSLLFVSTHRENGSPSLSDVNEAKTSLAEKAELVSYAGVGEAAARMALALETRAHAVTAEADSTGMAVALWRRMAVAL